MSQVDPPPQPYRHPGQVFLSRYGALQTDADVARYVAFLRQEADINDQPPIDLSAIYQHFGMPLPLQAPLVDQQGILVDSDSGLILIKADDPRVRQRFTEGHELMELLFDAQTRCSEIGHPALNWEESHKERLCDQGAAELLMPQSSFVPQLDQLGVSLETGGTLASLYQVSLLATLVRMIEHSGGAQALIMWHGALSRKDMQRFRNCGVKAKKKLRVWWRSRTQAWTCGFIPKNKSVSGNSLIARVYATGKPETGVEMIDLGGGPVHCRI
ncbi:MAG: ImmA/IrrE family metallo-endopeptidase, partial [Cyanothece sp. SIO1E1]|nr:ImmA/IrrE family metallo-endopeptidase [Cyanothece sp. SIO1E1]